MTYATPPVTSTATYASWIRRVGGFLIDGIITGVPVWIGATIFAASTTGGQPSSTGYFAYVVGGLAGLGLWVYNRLIQGGKTGQTWGRKVVGVRVVSVETGQPIGAGMAFVRDLVHWIAGIPCYLGYLWPLWDDKKQTLADKAVKTVSIAA
jgi:uncharacterized RDD family membrane protein YckC